MKNRKSLRTQLIWAFLAMVLLIFFVNVALFVRLDQEISELDEVYITNEENSNILEELTAVQDSMTDYLQSKSSDSLEDYYRATFALETYLEEIDCSITGSVEPAMRDDIQNMITAYFKLSNDTIAYKRGRDTENYRASYEEATTMYSYIRDMVQSLNTLQFAENSENYAAFRASLSQLIRMTFYIFFLICVVGALLAYLFANSITQPLRELSEKAETVSRGDFNVEFTQQRSGSEVGILTNAFAGMLLSIQSFMEREKEEMAERQAQKELKLRMEAEIQAAELKYLQAQINPHFLFNTLNAGVQLATLENAKRTEQYVKNVAEFYRYNIRQDDGVSTIKEEVRLARYYFAILKVRFGDSMDMIFDVDDSLGNVPLPKMTLQPLIENCVNHGIRNIERKGMIYLTIYEQGGEIIISIADNGVGMTEEQIAEVMAGTYVPLETGDSNGVGMSSVFERLNFIGGSASIVSAGLDEGTEIILHLPGNAKEEAEDV